MCVVRNISQLEDAMRKNARDVLVIGDLGNQLKRAFAEQECNDGKGALLQSFLKQIKKDYTISLRNRACCAPVVLQQNDRLLNDCDNGDNHGG